MGANRKTIPPEWTSATWGRVTAREVLSQMPRQSRTQLDENFELAVQLATLCDEADDQLRAEATLADGPKPGWDLIHVAFIFQFGLTLDFMARVREVWFKERGAKNTEQHSGETGVRGWAMIADPKTKRVQIKPKQIAHWTRRPVFRKWAEEFKTVNGRECGRVDIGEWFFHLGYDAPGDKQWTEAMKIVRDFIRKSRTLER